MDEKTHADSIRKWRQEYAQHLMSPEGWLAISGLFWLDQGENHMGAHPSNRIILPPHSAPEDSGTFILRDREITLQVTGSVKMTINDQPISNTQIVIDSYGSSEWISLNDLKLSVIQRGARYGVRIYDKNHPQLKQFVVLRWFPIQLDYCIEASFVPFDQPKTMYIVNVLGDTLEMASPGYAEFPLQGQVCRLHAVPVEESDRLWFLFQDVTSSDATYPGGRFLTTDAPHENIVTLDFNKAHNPPCAYTDFATCPLPPSINRLPVRVSAGESRYPRPVSHG
jgi:uncharacterized protein (DUF1684 family)